MKDSGMTLMEVLAALLVLTLLVTAMGTSLDLMARAVTSTRFAAESDALASVLQTTLADVLGFAESVRETADGLQFSNREYGITNGQLCLAEGKLCVREADSAPKLLTGSGVYDDLRISDLKILFIPAGESGAVTRLDGTEVAEIPGGVFYITFRIENGTGLFRDYETAVRLVNP